MANAWRAGAGETSITPPLEVPYLAGSGSGRSGRFERVHDDLACRALVLEREGRRVGIVGCDLMGLDRAGDIVRRVRDRAVAMGFGGGELMVAATHSHNTPDLTGLSRADTPVAMGWRATLVERILEALQQAVENMVGVEISLGSVQVPGLAENRRVVCADGRVYRSWQSPYPVAELYQGPIDPALGVLVAVDGDGRPRGAVVHYTAHPIVAMTIPEVSGDVAGYVSRRLTDELGCPVLYLNGAAADVNTARVSTGWEDVARLGDQMLAPARDLIGRLVKKGIALEGPLVHHRTTLVLHHRPDFRGPVDEPTPGLPDLPDPEHAEVQVVEVGPLALFAIPGELFCVYGLDLRARLGRPVWVVGYANQWLGYFPTPGAYREGAYEVQPRRWSTFPAGTPERLCAAGLDLIAGS